VSEKEALRFPVVVTVATSGLKERTAAGLPGWLAASFLLVAMFGVLQLAGATANPCGEGAELAVDRLSGDLLNCDGSPFEGRGEPGGGVDYAALGEEIYTGQVVPAANCAGCHGPQGQGGAGPAFATVVATFSSCTDHMEWVSKGTMGFQAEGRTTYGDLNKPVGGVGNMPGFGTSLTAEQIAAAVSFERVRFGGADPDQTLIDCGLVETPDEGAEGQAPAEGEGAATTAP
jgi:mono/diheme cytochrome c family protein